MTRVRIWNEPSATQIEEMPGDGCPACEFAALAVKRRPSGTTMRGAIVHVELLDKWDSDGRHFPAGTIRRVVVVSDLPLLACEGVSPDEVERERANIRRAWEQKKGRSS